LGGKVRSKKIFVILLSGYSPGKKWKKRKRDTRKRNPLRLIDEGKS